MRLSKIGLWVEPYTVSSGGPPPPPANGILTRGGSYITTRSVSYIVTR